MELYLCSPYMPSGLALDNITFAFTTFKTLKNE
jgi:hypothetical protein